MHCLSPFVFCGRLRLLSLQPAHGSPLLCHPAYVTNCNLRCLQTRKIETMSTVFSCENGISP
ncbi:methyl-accepting chemotaxis sensory transducer [Comamonas thiooxydans]|nr:methyl-accepting chemotaxis sensory transducer [Comamonas thiooxydans]